MRKLLYIFVVLIIYTTFSSTLKAQSITLQILGENNKANATIDSISYPPIHPNIKSADAAIDSLQNTLVSSGYFDLKETDRDLLTKETYRSNLVLGNHYNNIQLAVPPSERLRLYLRQNDLSIQNDSLTIGAIFAKALLEELTIKAANNGKPFSSFQIKNIQKKNTRTLTGTLQITEDTTRYINKIIIEGYKKMPPSYLKHYANLKTGVVFNQSKLLKQQNTLNTLPFAKSKKDLQVQFTQDSTNVYLYLEKQNTNRFDGFLGFATNETTNKLQLDGYLDLALTNNLNYGESLLLNYKSDGDDQQQLKIKLELPYLFGSPLGVTTQLNLFRKDTTFSENTQEASLFYQFKSTSRLSVGYKRKTSDNLLDAADTPEDLSDYSLNRLLSSFEYRNLQDNFLFPTKHYILAQGEIGRRSTKISEENQTSFSLIASSLFELNNQNQIFIKSTSHYLISDNYVTNELFRFGGITSIRGFEENSIFANLTTVLNTEYRYLLNPNTYIHSILDAGYFENETLKTDSELFSIGFGAGIQTKAGLFKINIANGKSRDQSFKFSNTKIHLQLETRF